MKHTFLDVDGLKGPCQVCGFRVSFLDSIAHPELFETLCLPKSSNRCECGSAKLGVKDFAIGHSSWCPVYK